MTVMGNEVDELRARVEELEVLAIAQRDTLDEIETLIDGYVDTVDGDNGPLPNKAMQATVLIQEASRKADKVLGV